MNQACKNVHSAKQKRQPLETCDISGLKSKKEYNVYINVYNVHKTTYSDQTGEFPTRYLAGNKYNMVMVGIDSRGILIEPMKSRKDVQMIRVYKTLIQQLQHAFITPKKHVLDN